MRFKKDDILTHVNPPSEHTFTFIQYFESSGPNDCHLHYNGDVGYASTWGMADSRCLWFAHGRHVLSEIAR